MPSFVLKRGFATGLFAIVVAGLAACGGGGSTVSVQQYQQQANRVCRDGDQQFDRILATNPITADQAEKQASALVDVSQQALDNLRQIKPPDSVQDAYNRYLDAREKAIGYIEDARNAAADKDGTGYARAKDKLAAAAPERRQLAIAAGLHDCSVPNVTLGKKSG